MRSIFICLFIILFVCEHAISQQFKQVIPAKIIHAKNLSKFSDMRPQQDSMKPEIHVFQFNSRLVTPAQYKTPITSQYYFENLGFFCQKEWQVQKAVKLPVYFRLGSVAYTDKMEGKNK